MAAIFIARTPSMKIRIRSLSVIGFKYLITKSRGYRDSLTFSSPELNMTWQPRKLLIEHLASIAYPPAEMLCCRRRPASRAGVKTPGQSAILPPNSAEIMESGALHWIRNGAICLFIHSPPPRSRGGNFVTQVSGSNNQTKAIAAFFLTPHTSIINF